MSISNYTGTASTFTFPYNPQVFDENLTTNYAVTNIGFQKHHIIVSGGGIPPRSIVITGHFSGTTKRTSFRSLAVHVEENYKLKKLYFETDKFYLCVGRQIKQTNSGGRTNFVDYVATFQTIIGILLDNTQQTYTDGGADATNDGDVTTYVEEISGDCTNGAVDITVTDALGNQITIPNGSLTTGHSVVITLVKMVDSGDGIYVSEYNYTEVNSVRIKTTRTTDGFGLIQLAASAAASGITVTNMDSGFTIKFRNGWSG